MRPWRRAPTILWLVAVGLAPTATPVVAQAGAQAVVGPVRVAWAALGVDLRLAVDRFEVRGRSFAEARGDLVEKGPRATDGSVRHALTTYAITAQWAVEGTPGSCRVADVSVGAEVHILLPRWFGAREAPERDYLAWLTLEEDLTGHETVHRDLALAAAHRLSSRLRTLEATTCPALDHLARAVIARTNDALRDAQDDVDRALTPPRQATPRRRRRASGAS